ESGQSLYDQLKAAMATNLDQIFSAGDEIFALHSTRGAPTLFEGARYNFESVGKIIQKSKVSHRVSDYFSALLAAERILENSRNANREIFFVSDFQLSGFNGDSAVVRELRADKDYQLFVVPVRKKRISNLVVSQIKIENQIIEKGKLFELSAIVKNTGDLELKNKLLQVFLENDRMGQATVSLSPGETQTIKFKLVPTKTGIISGFVAIEEDDLLLDNQRFFTLYVPDQIRVALIAREASDIKFLRLALNPNQQQSTRLLLDFLTPERIDFGALEKYHVVLLSNVRRVEGPLLSELENHVRQGKGLMIFMGSDADLRHYNENINQKFSLPMFTETRGELGKKDVGLTIGRIDYRHPIFSGVFESENRQIESPQIYFFVKIKSQPDDERIIELSSGDPFLIESAAFQGKALMFTSGIDPDWSDLYVKGLFVPLVNRGVLYLADNTRQQFTEIFIDDELSATLSQVESYSDLKVERPDGRSHQVKPVVEKGSLKISHQNTDEPGIYTLFNGKELVTKWAVNFHPLESELNYIAQTELSNIMGDLRVVDLKTGNMVKDVKLTRHGRELWKFVLALALLLLIVEMILGRESTAEINTAGAEKFD
ncbi:MAG: hypothetical protein SCK70_07715, partial [bacterium]|nr:hypothetical protein [bacterium]